jgi:hypothetical protein
MPIYTGLLTGSLPLSHIHTLEVNNAIHQEKATTKEA